MATIPTPNISSYNSHTHAISVENLTHTYPSKSTSTQYKPALNNLTLNIEPGQVFGILGPNGSGKTTLFRILSTLLRPTSGRVFVFGYDAQTQPDKVRQQLGVVFQMPSLDVKLTAKENLLYQGHLYGLSGGQLRSRIEQLLADTGLADKSDAYVETYSGGMRRRVELAKALLHTPPLLLLDEPSTGLDVGARRDLWQHLDQLRRDQGVTIVLTTHLMEEADRCDRLAIMADGRLAALDTPNNLKSRIGGDVITVEPATDETQEIQNDITQRFGPWEEGASPVTVDGRIHFEKADGPAFIATLAQALPGKINRITVGPPTLENVFMHLTGQSLWRSNQD